MKQPPIYIVQPGDSLSMISKKLYGDFSRVDEIAAMNKIRNADLIYPGQQLIVPDLPEVIDTKAEVISSTLQPTQTTIQVFIKKAFPWFIILGAAYLLGREALKQKKKNKKASLNGFDE